jgi:membrane-associated protease RseP (regulator of RpoE activity)
VTPALVPGSTDTARIGIYFGDSSVRVPPLQAIGTAGLWVGRLTTATLSALGSKFSPHGLSSFFGQLDNTKAADAAAKTDSRPVSIVGAARVAVEGAQGGISDLLGSLVAIIIGVGIINLFPMLPLDGGHVLVAVYERIRSRRGRPYRADVTKLIPVASAFVLFLVIFVAAAVFLDITHPIANPFQ